MIPVGRLRLAAGSAAVLKYGAVRDAGITGRELEVARLVAAGLDNREIGKRLFISPKTVKNHLTSIYAKTGARNRVQLANFLGRPGDGPGR